MVLEMFFTLTIVLGYGNMATEFRTSTYLLQILRFFASRRLGGYKIMTLIGKMFDKEIYSRNIRSVYSTQHGLHFVKSYHPVKAHSGPYFHLKVQFHE